MSRNKNKCDKSAGDDSREEVWTYIGPVPLQEEIFENPGVGGFDGFGTLFDENSNAAKNNQYDGFRTLFGNFRNMLKTGSPEIPKKPSENTKIE